VGTSSGGLGACSLEALASGMPRRQQATRPARLALVPGTLYAGGPVRTYSPKAAEVHRDWWEVDASGAVLGRLASDVARILRGKHKPVFAPHLDTGDHVVVVNAAQVVLTAGKADRKVHYRYSGYPGGLKARSYAEMLSRRPEDVVRLAVKGMLPKGPLGRQMARKLKVYAGPEHPHAAQKPKPLVLDHSAHRVPAHRVPADRVAGHRGSAQQAGGPAKVA